MNYNENHVQLGMGELNRIIEEKLDEIATKYDCILTRRGAGFMQGLVFDRPVGPIINKAIEKGASAIVCENFPEEIIEDITYIKVHSTEDCVGSLATAYYNDPTSKLELIGVTGTNGKTTTTSLVSHILSQSFDAPTCGNIGLPPSSIVNDENDFLVCEISSYQAQMTKDFKPFISNLLL